MEKIDVDFARDTDGFWDGNEKMVETHIEYVTGVKPNHQSYRGPGYFVDPDEHSKMLQQLHKKIWSGTVLDLKEGKGLDLENQLTPKNLRFSSDTIFTSFVGYDKQCKQLFNEVIKYFGGEDNYRAYVEGYTREFYRNIGSFIIFPKIDGRKFDTINQARGNNNFIQDRFDLTLECIRRHYNQEKDFPLDKVLAENKEFFDLFGSFEGYVNYFCLQDLVEKDATGEHYTGVKFWLARQNAANIKSWLVDNDFMESPFPKDAKEYLELMEKQLEFVKNRTKRINEALLERNK